jgi:hypothetical protein
LLKIENILLILKYEEFKKLILFNFNVSIKKIAFFLIPKPLSLLVIFYLSKITDGRLNKVFFRKLGKKDFTVSIKNNPVFSNPLSLLVIFYLSKITDGRLNKVFF